MTASEDLQKAIRLITRAFIKSLEDIRVDLADEFDRNFERQAFFSEAWQRHASPRRNSHILVDTGQLRRSIHSETDTKKMSVRFFTDLPYAAIHNEGGEIKVTKRMIKFFWHKYYESVGSLSRKKNGDYRNDKRNRTITTEASFWKAMALKKPGSKIKIPRRQFLGTGSNVESIVSSIIEENIKALTQ